MPKRTGRYPLAWALFLPYVVDGQEFEAGGAVEAEERGAGLHVDRDGLDHGRDFGGSSRLLKK
jgi:hypothetical protein